MDVEALAENLGLEKHEYMKLLSLFLETASSDMSKLQSAIEEKDAQKAAVAAHSIKGAAGNLRLIKIHENAKEIEEDAREKCLEASAVQELKENLELLAESIQTQFGSA